MTSNPSKINILYCVQTSVKREESDLLFPGSSFSVQSIEFKRFAELDLTSDFSVFDAVIFRIDKLDDSVAEIIEQHLRSKKSIFYFIYDEIKPSILDKYQQNYNFVFLPYIPRSSPYIQLLLKLPLKYDDRLASGSEYFTEKFKDFPFPFLVFGMRGKAQLANEEFYKEFFYEKQDIRKIRLNDLLIGISAETILRNANDNPSIFPQTYSCSIIDGKRNIVPCEGHFIFHRIGTKPCLLLFFKNVSKLNQQEKIVIEHSKSFHLVSQIIDLLSKIDDIDFYDDIMNKKLRELFSADHIISISSEEETGELEFNQLQSADKTLIPPVKTFIHVALKTQKPSIFQIDPTKIVGAQTAFRSVFIIPLLSSNNLFGIMILFYLNRFEPSLLQVELAEMVSRLFGNYLSKALFLKKLRASENLFKTAVENAMNGIYQSTPEGKILFANKALLKMLGYNSLEEMQQLNLSEDIYSDPEDRQKFIRELEKNKVITNCTVKLRRKDGSSIIAIENSYILEDAKGRHFYQGSLHNIGSYQELQHSLKKAEKFNADFLNNSGFIIAGFNQDGVLKIWNRLAAQLTGFTRAEIGEKEAFLHLIKHYSKNNSEQENTGYGLLKTTIETKEQKMVTIIWDVENLNYPQYGLLEVWIGMRFIDEPFSSGRNTYMKDIVNDQLKLLSDFFDKLIHEGTKKNIALQELHKTFLEYKNKYLTYSEISAITEISDTSINAMEIAEQTILLLKNFIPAEITLFMNLEFAGFVQIQKKSLEIIFEQLLLNAIESIDSTGEIAFSSRIVTSKDEIPENPEKEELSLPAALFSIADTGRGIESADLKTVTEPFTTSKNPLEHAGLGLYIAKQIISVLGGKLLINSTIGKGTNVMVLLPAEQIHQKAGQKGTTIEEKTSVLIVDDESVIRELINDVLTSKNINVISASDGIEGYEKFLTNKDNIGLVILDIIMPGMDGKELYYKIKKIEKDVKVIITSGYSKHNVKDELLQAGVDNFLSKPFNINELTNLLDTVFPEHNNK